MKVTFLSAGVPLAKRFELDPNNGALIKHPYPHAFEFTSHTVDVPDLPALAKLITEHGEQGHCLLKGEIGRNLQQESRAGSTDANTPTTWVCFDLDGAEFPTVEDFLLHVGLGDVSYVLQWSASHGLDKKNSGLRCHIFMLLSSPQNPTILKQWLQYLNLNTTTLRNGTKLTKTCCALTWPLDITTCQNDKLLYIAPPILGAGLVDPIATRVTYVKKGRETMDLPQTIPSQSSLRLLIDRRINELRTVAALPPRKPSQYKHAGQVEYLVKPELAVVTSVKHERGFTYLNLNGGDSYAYYHPEDNCEFIYNFKGEPTYRTSELCPDYYNQARESSARGSKIFLAFRDFDSSILYNGFYDEETEDLELRVVRNENQLRDYLKQHGKELGEFVPTWKIVYDPHDPVIVNLKAKTVNTFAPTPIMKMPVVHRDKLPPLTQRVLNNLMSNDPVLVDAFNNWFACLLQYRRPLMVAWAWTGIQGTGKGAFLNKVALEILGKQHMHIVRMESLESEFTHVFENKLLVVIDEIHTAASHKQERVVAKLKNIIVEPTIDVRRMYRESYMTKNYMSAIMTSNKHVPIDVEASDRRFNLPPYVETKLDMTKYEVEVELPKEAYDAYCFWMSYPADLERAGRVIDTDNRQYIIDANISSGDHIARFLLKGQLKEFFDLLPTNEEGDAMLRNRLANPLFNVRAAYISLVRELIHNLPNKLSRDDLHTIFKHCVGGVPDTPHKFTSYLRHMNIHIKDVRIGKRTVKGIEVDWKYDPAWLAQARLEI
jgi:hypothetical protein